MKRIFTLLSLSFLVATVQAQSPSTFDNMVPQIDTFFNGSDGTISYTDADAIFPTTFNFDWGVWSGGWAMSSMTDSIDTGFTNLYTSRPASGVSGSIGYAVGQQGAMIILGDGAQDQPLKGVFITNAFYPYHSIRDGDGFAKKFGGDTGDDPDYFLLTIRGFSAGEITADSVNFYLADFRSDDNSLDYIVDSWEYVDLSSLGTVDSLSFNLASTDIGDFGINTPLFFCIDHFNSSDITGTNNRSNQLSVKAYPNPTTDLITVATDANAWLQIINAQGKVLATVETQEGTTQLDLSNHPSGTYFIHYFDNEQQGVTTIIKK